MTTRGDHRARLHNREGRDDFAVEWRWRRRHLTPGLTAVLRVRNEARSMPWVLPPLFTATRHVLVVDNGSTDETPAVARRVAAEHGRADKLTVTGYPFTVSRCGDEHLATPTDSVHSLVYFYNWAFAQVGTTYSLKWDGDMVLTADGAATIADLGWQVQPLQAVALMPRHPLYVESDRVAYLDLAHRNVEEYLHPNRPGFHFVKAFEWELRAVPEGTRTERLPQGLCVELKHLDSDEFGHWSSSDAFLGSARALRKQREWHVFTTLARGRWRDLDGVHRIEAPAGVHVVDHTVGTWLPRAPRPLLPPVRDAEGAGEAGPGARAPRARAAR